MDCPNCGATNAPDRDFCWRCNAELPKPKEKKTRNRRVIAGLPLWMWVVLAAVFFSMTVGQCMFLPQVPT